MRSPSKIVAVTPAAIEIEKRAIEREKKGQFRIAAHLWLQCMDVASGDVERARIAVRRDQIHPGYTGTKPQMVIAVPVLNIRL